MRTIIFDKTIVTHTLQAMLPWTNSKPQTKMPYALISGIYQCTTKAQIRLYIIVHPLKILIATFCTIAQNVNPNCKDTN